MLKKYTKNLLKDIQNYPNNNNKISDSSKFVISQIITPLTS